MSSTTIELQLADQSLLKPVGIVHGLVVHVDKFKYPVDFVVVEMKEYRHFTLLLGRPFLDTAGVIMDISRGKMRLESGDDYHYYAKPGKEPQAMSTSNATCSMQA